MATYGIFEVGQYWRVVGPDRWQLGFPSREAALAAAAALQSDHRARGDQCTFLALDEAGRLAELTITDALAAGCVAGDPRRPRRGDGRAGP